MRMSDLSSVMDKIRILRSNRLKARYVKAVENKATVTLAPVSSSDSIFTSSGNQWVPFVILDIGQSQNEQFSFGEAHQPLEVSAGNTVPLSTAVSANGSISVITSTVASGLSSDASQLVRDSNSNDDEVRVITSRPMKRKASPKKIQDIPKSNTITAVKRSPRKNKSNAKYSDIPKPSKSNSDSFVNKKYIVTKDGCSISAYSVSGNSNKLLSGDATTKKQDTKKKKVPTATLR